MQAGLRGAALAPTALWARLWPMLLDAMLALASRRLKYRVPYDLGGDIVVESETAVCYVAAWAGRSTAPVASSGDGRWPMLPFVGFAILIVAVLAVRP